jgi:TolB-like protein
MPAVKKSLPSGAETGLVVSSDESRRQLQRILDSPEFHATDRQREFLKFVVAETLGGRSHTVKAYTVATRVFGRTDDFDQATDPIVSIQANQLRRALERYYLVAGQNDPVVIDIPKGGYVPTFQRQGDVDSRKTQHDEDITQWDKDAWPKLLVKPFENLANDPELSSVGVGIATELAVEIARHQELRVIFARARERESTSAAERSVGFVLDGTVQKDTASIKVSFALTDTATNIRFWGDSYTASFDPSKLISYQEEAAHTIAYKILSEQGAIPTIMSNESRINAPVGFSTYDAILKYYAFAADFCADNFFTAFEALTWATENDPTCGLAWAMLARLYGNNYALEIFDLETPIEDAALFSARGVALEPSNQRVRVIRAYVDFLNGDLDAGEAEITKALELNPKSLLFLDSIGYLMTLLGDWKQGPALIRRAIKLNPNHYHFSSYHALWVDWIRQGDYEQAYRETMNFKKPTLFWEPLMKAASCGLLGNIARGKRFADDLFRLKPEFRKRGRTLIRHYIKFDDIYDRISKGLNDVGVQVE